MKLYSFNRDTSHVIDQYGSRNAVVTHLANGDNQWFFVCIRLDAGGLLGRHRAVNTQLFCVIEGQGVVSGDDEEFLPIETGQAALWEPGEMHETRTENGLVAIVVAGKNLDPDPRLTLIKI